MQAIVARSLCLWDFVEPELIAGQTDDGGMDWAKKESHTLRAPLPGTKSVVIPVSRGLPFKTFALFRGRKRIPPSGSPNQKQTKGTSYLSK